MKKYGNLNRLKSNTIKQLNPFLDENGLVRVGGRLENAKIPFTQKHPLLLPAKHYVTRLILRYHHEILLHVGNQTVMSNVRKKYWPINAKREIKQIILNCVKCARFKNVRLQQLMANLPEERVIPTRIFQSVGIDYCGPIIIKQR